MSIEEAVRAACLLEVTARKVGNVHPLAAFADCDWDTFAASADAIAPVLKLAPKRPLGETILRCVEETKSWVGTNTNLGIILLLTPLAAAGEGADLRGSVTRVLDESTVDDCRLVYEAIRVAKPGGLGNASREDVSDAPSVTIVEAMRLASDRDAVARQYANRFADVFAYAETLGAHDLAGLEREIVTAHLRMIADGHETLVRRKCGDVVAQDASERAAKALQAVESGDSCAAGKLESYDAWLRADGNRRNPGTSADLIAASLYVAVRERRVPCFAAVEISGYADGLRRSAQPVCGFGAH